MASLTPEIPAHATTSVAYIALGANLGDPIAQLRAAVAAIAELPTVQVMALSSFYRSAPIGISADPSAPHHDDYVNAVLAIRTEHSARALLTQLLLLETRFGRQRPEHIGDIACSAAPLPRPLDLDLLLYGKQQVHAAGLTVPHPRMHLRAFVLVPLCEIAPDVEIPGRGPARHWLPGVADQSLSRLLP